MNATNHLACRSKRAEIASILLGTFCSLCLAAEPGPASPAGSPEQSWYLRSLVGMEVGPTGAQFGHSDMGDTRYCARFDGREIVRRSAAAGCDYLVIWARDGDYAYYDSKLLPKAPGLGSRDPLREAVAAARRHRLSIIAYCVVQQGGHFLEAHPEFAMRDSSGKPIGRFCLNSGYLAAMKAIVAEQLACGIDGFHIDMLDQGFGPPYGCWCDACRKQFAAEFSRPMPNGVTWDEDWDRMLEFRYRSSQRFEKALAAHIKSLNPRASVDFNYHGNPPFSFEVGQRPVQHAVCGNFVTGETGAWGFSALTVGLNAEFYRAATPGWPFQVAMQRGVRMYHDQTTRPLNDIRWELFTLLAHGAFVTMVDKTGFDGALDPVAYERIGAAFSEARAKREQFGQAPVYDVGLLYDSRTRDWIGREKAGDWCESFLGAQKACVYEHLTYGVILDENLDLHGLSRFPVVCLPNIGILSQREIHVLRDYIRQGGGLLVTGQSGLFDRMGKPLARSAIGDLIGAEAIGTLDTLDNWVRFSGKDLAGPSNDGASIANSGRLGGRLAAFFRADWPLLVHGPATMYRPTTASAWGELLKPLRTKRDNYGWPMSPDRPVGPALLVNRIGLGTVVTFACSPDAATASEWPVVEARRLFAAVVRSLYGAPRVRVEAPVHVESVVTDDPARRTLRVHLVAYQAPPQTMNAKNRPFILPALVEEVPLYRVVVETAARLQEARAWNRSTVLKTEGRRVEALVNDIHEVLLLSY